MTSELTGHDTDQPPENTETGLRADRDITPVPEHAGRNIGMTRAEAYAQLYGPAPGNKNTGGNGDGDSSDTGQHNGSTSCDNARNDQPEKPGTGRAGDSSPDREGQETGTGAGQAAADASTREQAGTRDADDGDHEPARPRSSGDRDTGLTPAAPSTEGTATRTLARPGPPDSLEAAVPVPPARDRAQDDTASRDNRGSGSRNGPDRDADRSAGSQETVGPRNDSRDGEDAEEYSRTGPEAAGSDARQTDAMEGGTTEASSGETPAQRRKEQPDGPNPEAEPGTGQPDETGAEPAPDQHADDERYAALERRTQAALDGMRAEIDALKTEHKAETDSLRTDYESKFDHLKAGYDASSAHLREEVDNLTTEVETLKSGQQPAREMPRTPDAAISGQNDSPQASDAVRHQHSVLDQEGAVLGKAAEQPEQESDRPGLWSNAKAALYGAVGTTVVLTGADQFVPGAPHTAIDLIVGGLTIAAAAVPVTREGWRKKNHDD